MTVCPNERLPRTSSSGKPSIARTQRLAHAQRILDQATRSFPRRVFLTDRDAGDHQAKTTPCAEEAASVIPFPGSRTGCVSQRITADASSIQAASSERKEARIVVALGRKTVAGLDTPAQRTAGRARLMKQLSMKRLSMAEAVSALTQHGASSEERDGIIDHLVRSGYLDDRDFAEHILYTQRERKGFSDKAVRYEMLRRKIPDHLISEVLTAHPKSDHERATALVRNRLRKSVSDDPVVMERRLTAYLCRKGYSSHIARSAVRECLLVK